MSSISFRRAGVFFRGMSTISSSLASCLILLVRFLASSTPSSDIFSRTLNDFSFFRSSRFRKSVTSRTREAAT